ncbi:hypothetical protein HY485_01145 [Candidatus Woesearchaeota archaeon]|nr:hypothetical protein [Candidatus Woesearchaeota archaeon]
MIGSPIISTVRLEGNSIVIGVPKKFIESSLSGNIADFRFRVGSGLGIAHNQLVYEPNSNGELNFTQKDNRTVVIPVPHPWPNWSKIQAGQQVVWETSGTVVQQGDSKSPALIAKFLR